MTLPSLQRIISGINRLTLSLALGVGLTAGAQAGTWSHHAWTNDATSGIAGVQADYTMAVNTGTAGDAAVTVNGINFQTHATSGTNFTMAGAFASTGRATNVTGSSATLATNFLYNGSPRTVTFTNLTVGKAYEASFFAFGWEASGRIQTFASSGDSYVVDQDTYGTNNGIRVYYQYVATATSQAVTITPGAGGTFHMSAVSNRAFPAATIVFFGKNVANSTAVISPASGGTGTISWTVPFGSNLATLAPTFSLNAPTATSNQTSGAVPTPNFSSGPVTYTITDGATVNNYTVTAVVAPPSTAANITAFDAGFPGSNAVITSTGAATGTVEVVLPQGTPAVVAGSLAPTFSLSTGATANRVSGVRPTPALSTAGTVTYTVTAQDGITTKDWAVSVRVSGWKYSEWTGDADSGITGVQGDYTVAVNTGTAGDAAVTVNGIAFDTNAASGANYTIGGAISSTGRSTNVTGSSKTLADNFIYGASPRTITLNNLTIGATYETSLYSYAWDALPTSRSQTFAAGSDSYIANQNAFNLSNGIRISYRFVASATSQVITVTQTPTAIGSFHLSALANRLVPPPVDTDADGLADSWEMDKAGNLTDLTGLLNGPGPGAGTGNFDGDGLSDADEFGLSGLYPGLNPKLADTDGDGLSDDAELFPTLPRAGTRPTSADSDGDGLNDLIETNTGTYASPTDLGTNPNNVDSDGDQFPDAYELSHGGNPVLASSIPNILPAGILLHQVTDEVSTGISSSEIYTHKFSGGSAAVVNGVSLDVLTDSVTPANFTWEQNPVGKNIIGPAINNGTWNPVAGNVTGDGNLLMFGTFSYAGAAAASGNTEKFTLSALEPGLTYELRLFIRKWDDGTVRPQYTKFTNGAAVTDFYILEDRPGTMLGNANDNSAYYLSFTYVAQATTLSIETKVANVSSATGSFHLYGLTNRQASEPPPLDFISVARAADGSKTTLTIASRPNRTYKVEASFDLTNWFELSDAVPSTGTATVFEDTAVSNLQRVQYRVTDVTP